MHNKVVYHAMQALQAHGLRFLRFNSVAPASAKAFTTRHGETGSPLRTDLDWLEAEYQNPSICGFSFGAAVGTRTCCTVMIKGCRHRCFGASSQGPPAGGIPPLLSCQLHPAKLFISDEREYAPQQEVEAAPVRLAPHPTNFIFVREPITSSPAKPTRDNKALTLWPKPTSRTLRTSRPAVIFRKDAAARI